MKNPHASLTPALLDAAATLVRRRTGLTFAGTRTSAFESGLLKAMRSADPSDPAAYVARLESEIQLLDALVAEITIGETHFFRDPGQWELLRTEILPPLLAHRSHDRPVRFWSAGCASGEEPYTAAILLQQLGAADDAYIVGTDLSRPALVAARRGQYTRWSLRGVPEDIIRRYFHQHGQRFELAPSVRGMVEFHYFNLVADSRFGAGVGPVAIDVVMCRNVLIYFDAESLPRVAQRLLDALSEDGWLLLGASDPVISGIVPCDVQVTSAGLVYRRPRTSAAFAAVPAAPAGLQANLFVAPSPARRPDPVPPAPRRVAPPLPGDADEVKRRYAARDYRGATEFASSLLMRGERDHAVCVLNVRALANQGDLMEAGRASAAALELHRGSAELTYLHAVLLMESGRPAEAAEAARRALYLDRGLAVAHLLLGGALARIGDTGSACRSVRNAQRLLTAMHPDDIVPASDGESAGRLAELAKAQVQLLVGATI